MSVADRPISFPPSRKWRTPAALCLQYGHFIMRDYIMGILPYGRPYCRRCGKVFDA